MYMFVFFLHNEAYFKVIIFKKYILKQKHKI